MTTGGGCIGKGGVNCLAISGALSVECAASQCSVCASIFHSHIYIGRLPTDTRHTNQQRRAFRDGNSVTENALVIR